MYIELSNINKTYERNILNSVSYKFESGKCYGILGENGAGKSTLLKIIAGLETKCSGYINYDGFDKNNELTYVGPSSYVMKKTVYDNIAYPLKIRGEDKTKISEGVSELLIRFGLGKFKETKARKLSSGESQKMLLARAMVFRPKVLLLDEPTSNIDKNFIKTIESVIKSIDYECIIILVTHNMEHAENICDEVLVLEDANLRLDTKGD
ncbi:MAG: ABC transporter ATP-binding protein [Acidaminobacteraceae bacterium]